jgi:hypothetical protein
MAKLILSTLLFFASMAAAESWFPLSYAEQPTREFNQHISNSAAKNERWVNDSQQVALNYLGAPEQIEIVSELREKDVVEIALRQPQNQNGVESTLFFLQLKQNADGIWLIDTARVAWRCSDQGQFDTRRCQDNY